MPAPPAVNAASGGGSGREPAAVRERLKGARLVSRPRLFMPTRRPSLAMPAVTLAAKSSPHAETVSSFVIVQVLQRRSVDACSKPQSNAKDALAQHATADRKAKATNAHLATPAPSAPSIRPPPGRPPATFPPYPTGQPGESRVKASDRGGGCSRRPQQWCVVLCNLSLTCSRRRQGRAQAEASQCRRRRAIRRPHLGSTQYPKDGGQDRDTAGREFGRACNVKGGSTVLAPTGAECP